MSTQRESINDIFKNLTGQTRELNCLYRIEEIFGQTKNLNDFLEQVVAVLPDYFQYVDLCTIRLVCRNHEFKSPDYKRTSHFLQVPIKTYSNTFGFIDISYTRHSVQMGKDPFSEEEKRLLKTVGERLGYAVFQIEYQNSLKNWQDARTDLNNEKKKEWKIILDLLRKTDQKLFSRISRKMANHLVWSGHKQATEFIQQFSHKQQDTLQPVFEDINQPSQKQTLATVIELGKEIFAFAENILTDDEILNSIQKWIHEEKASNIVQILGHHDSTLSEIVEAITRYHFLGSKEGIKLSSHTDMGLRVSLIRQFFFDQLSFINIAKNFIEVDDFFNLLQKVIFPVHSQGKLGGKSAGLFLAYHILKKSPDAKELFHNLKMPATWYVSSDGLPNFIKYNNLEEVTEQKYKETDQVRMEYPQIIQLFKNSYFSPDILRGLSMALDDIGESPIVVRSSSLLEDRLGTAFSGKYKSLFLANQGPISTRLDALTDAIAEVYASTFGPDPIEYRSERGLLDFYEEMGIMIQEVIGNKAGKYFLPTYAGVAFSHNEFRWSSRITRDDGLIRLVPGLGTRAVDRTSDDYPVLIAPGKPLLKVNTTPREIVRYSPRKIDVINLETNLFETIEISEFLKEFGDDLPGIARVVSKFEDDHLRPAGPLTDYEKDDLVVTFDGLRQKTRFVKQMYEMLNILEREMGNPVDIEFASDGKNFYLLQCRPQSNSSGAASTPIPTNIDPDQLLFSARKYVTNGIVPPISHIVYVDPDSYNNLKTLEEMQAVGHAIAKLNKLLPKRRFILMGPGRWGSRGDIKLGVNVSYSDFNNTSALIEIALKKGKYVPELSFGTHFFQDLVEAEIRYLPLYPDDENVSFNWDYFKNTHSILLDVLPEYEYLEKTLRVIDIPESNSGKMLFLLMNADEDHAVAVLSSEKDTFTASENSRECEDYQINNHWSWRLRMARVMALELGRRNYGVKAVYLFGSTQNKNAEADSDINMIFHFTGSETQREVLKNWLNGWSSSLAAVNYLRTGVRSPDGLLDANIVTDRDIEQNYGHAQKIHAVIDPAYLLPMEE